MSTRNTTATDDYSWSTCIAPGCDRTFLLFHCHSYTSNESSNVYGKPIYVEALSTDKGGKFPKRKMFDRVFYDISRMVRNGIYYNLHDTAICSVFKRMIGRDIRETKNLSFCQLVSVPIDYVIETKSPYSILEEILLESKEIREKIHAFLDILDISVEDCGITGSWALRCNRKDSDVDIVVRLSPGETKQFVRKLEALKKSDEGSLLRDKFGYIWPLRIKLFSYKWCIFVTYRAVEQSMLLGAKLTRTGKPIPIEGHVRDDSHSLFCPTVLEVEQENGETFYAIFPSTEARGVFYEDDYFDSVGIPCLWQSEGEKAVNNRLSYVVVDGIKTCKSLLRKVCGFL